MVTARADAGRAVVQAAPPTRIRRSPLPVRRRDTTDVIRRVNSFYGNFPQAEQKESPLATIARCLHADAGVNPDDLRKHWLKDTTLAVAKTAKTALTAGPMQTVMRPKEAAAWLDTPNPNPGERKDPSWITAIGNLGTVEDQIVGDSPKKYNGGHLIAWEFLNAAANVQGNIAPQSDLQNQALFRRIERVLEHTVVVQGGPGIEVGVKTPYHHDNYTVTYQQLFDRKVLTDASLYELLKQRNLLGNSLTFAQMAPDTYDVYFLTQTGTASMVPADVRQGRENIKTVGLPDYQESTANRLIGKQAVPSLAILASNYDEATGDQVAASFAHIVYLNHRATPPVQKVPDDTALKQQLQQRRQHAIEVIYENGKLAYLVQRHLEDEYGLTSTESNEALIQLLIQTEPV